MNSSDPRRLADALQALEGYGPGGSRAALLPIDEAVRGVLQDSVQCQALEGELLECLEAASLRGQIYLMSKLALIGSVAAVEPLARRLGRPELAAAACRALEAVVCPEAAAALRERLPTLSGNALIGAMTVLGRKRDSASVALLAQSVFAADRAVADASLGALGRIGSPAAGRALRRALADADGDRRRSIVRAAQDCADRLAREHRGRDAARLEEALRRAGRS